MNFMQMADKRAFIRTRLSAANTMLMRAEVFRCIMNSVAMALKISFECKGEHVAQTAAVRTEMFFVSVALAAVESRYASKGQFIHLLGHILHLAVTSRVAG